MEDDEGDLLGWLFDDEDKPASLVVEVPEAVKMGACPMSSLHKCTVGKISKFRRIRNFFLKLSELENKKLMAIFAHREVDQIQNTK